MAAWLNLSKFLAGLAVFDDLFCRQLVAEALENPPIERIDNREAAQVVDGASPPARLAGFQPVAFRRATSAQSLGNPSRDPYRGTITITTPTHRSQGLYLDFLPKLNSRTIRLVDNVSPREFK